MASGEKSSCGPSDREGYFAAVVGALKAGGVALGPSLSEEEIALIEQSFKLRFPPDLRDLLLHLMPMGNGFPDWRGPKDEVDKIMSWPTEGICLDVERNGFWLRAWGPRPADPEKALRIAREAASEAPKLVPVYKHRYLPSEPLSEGNPVLSVYQSDVIYYGLDLPGYLNREFGAPAPPWARRDHRPIRFWDEVIQANEERDPG